MLNLLGFRSLLRFLCFFNFPRLQELVDRVLERFQASGLIVKEWNSVKLHATVMNTLFRKDPNGKCSIEPQYSLWPARSNDNPGVWREWAIKGSLTYLLFYIRYLILMSTMEVGKDIACMGLYSFSNLILFLHIGLLDVASKNAGFLSKF